jgi:hemolysin activation/secretion protein
MHSLVITSQHEKVHTRYYETTSMFGDSVSIEQLAGTSGLAQVELGHMPATDFGFNRFLLDLRRFQPILKGLSFDSRFRFEATTGDPIFQKLEFLGGPGSLPALYRKSLIGNRMLLLNTEIRLSLGILTSALRAPDFDLVIYNDFGKIGMAANGESILQGYGFSGASSILYNVGIGLGWTNGIQVGVTWPTNVKDDPRLIFRLQRPF